MAERIFGESWLGKSLARPTAWQMQVSGGKPIVAVITDTRDWGIHCMNPHPGPCPAYREREFRQTRAHGAGGARFMDHAYWTI